MQNLRINRSRSFWPLIASLIILLVYWIVIVPGIRGAQDFPYTFQASLVEGFNLPQTWSTRTMGWIGEYVVGTLWSWPVDFLYGVGGMVGVDFWLLERLLGIFPAILLAAYSINAAFNYYEVKGLGKIAGTLLYLLNSYFILLIDGGQIAIALAYALLPLCFVNFLEAQGGSIKFKLFFGICVSALGFFDIRFVYVLGILIFLKILFDFAVLRKVKIIGNHFKTGTTTIFVFLGLNAYWLLPAFLAKHPALPSAFVQRSQIDFLSFAKLGHALSLLSPHWYKNVFGKVTPLNPWLFVIPLFVFLTPMLVRRKQVFFWTLVAFLSVFLVKGNNPPFEGVYELLFLHLPGFSLFRDPTKFFVLVCLAYSILFGNVLTVIMHRLPRVKTVALFAIAVYFVASTFPVWSNQMTGLLSFSRYEDEYKAVAKIMESDMGYGRILWVPKKYPLGFSSPNHSSVELSAMVQKWPFARGVVGKYEYSNFLREMPHIGQLLDVLGVKYLAFPFPDTKREDIKQDNVDYYYSFLDQISSQAWVQERLALPPVALLKTKESQNRFFVSENTLAVIGSDDIYKDFVKSSNFRLANNAIIFLEETPGLGSRLKDLPDPEVILNSKANIDLAVALNVPKELFFFPATQLPADPDSKSGWPASNVLRSNAGWWKRETNDIIWWRDFLETKYGIDNRDFDYGGGWGVAEGNLGLEVTSDKFKKDYILLARVMESSRGGKVEIFQNGDIIGEINTRLYRPLKTTVKLTGYKETPDQIFEYDKASFGWQEVGKLTKDSGTITLVTEGDINVVNALVTLPEDLWEEYAWQTYQMTQGGKVYWYGGENRIDLEKIAVSSNSASVSYTRISPTHYKVKISGLGKASTLVFSESFDPLWQLAGQPAFPVYGLVNGFKLTQDGEFDIFYSPQKYVYPGLIVSIFTVITIIVLYAHLSNKNSFHP